MECPYPEHRLINGGGLCASHTCPAREEGECAGEATNGRRPDFYVYVASRLSGDPGEYLANVAELSRVCRRLMEAGYVVINPAGDMLEGLVSPEPLPVQFYQERSLGLLRLCIAAHRAGHRAALLIVNDRHRDGALSGGVARERQVAEEAGLPVVTCVEDLHRLRGTEP